MPSITKLASGNWRAQVRRKGCYAAAPFRRRRDTEEWALDTERCIDHGKRRAKRGAGPATLTIDFSFIRTVLSQAAAVHGIDVATEAGIEPSVGSVGDSYDNALAETINGLYKAEVIHRRGPWPSFEAVELATLEWVDWFNNRRLLELIGNIPPAEAEARYYAQSNELARVA